MSFVAYNILRVTGFRSEKEREDFKAAVSNGKSAFSFENILPIEEGDGWGQRVKEEWGAWIYEHEEGEPGLCYTNTVEEFTVKNELGLVFHFRTHNGYPDHGIRNLSKLFPSLMFTLYSYDDYGFEGFISYYNGNGNVHDVNTFDTEQGPLLDVMIFAHRYSGYWWQHMDVNYFGLLNLGLPEKCQIPEEENTKVGSFDDDVPF